MSVCRPLAYLAISLLLAAGATMVRAGGARADGLTCAAAIAGASPSGPGTATNSAAAPTPGNPCWTDVTPYPFGSDGNPVDPNSALCDPSAAYGPDWIGDFNLAGPGGTGIQPPCYLQVESMAFRAWNRGLAATGAPPGSAVSSNIAYGVWLFNGTNWFPDPSFPGSAECPGSTIMWAGKLDYWLVGSSGSPQTTLCRFDGVNLDWQPLTLPAATLARLPVDASGKVVGGITSGTCYAWNNCWFFGDDGIEVYWDGQALTDASSGLGTSPWLEGDFTSAVSGTDPSGRTFGLAVAKSSCDFLLTPPCSTTKVNGSYLGSLPAAPDGTPPAQVYGSGGGSWSPLAYSPPATPRPGDPFTTDLTLVSADGSGDVWAAGQPASRLDTDDGDVSQEPAPLAPLSEAGSQESCPGYGATTFTAQPAPAASANRPSIIRGYTWLGLSTFPDGTALAGAGYDGGAVWTADTGTTSYPVGRISEPLLVHAACGQPPQIMQFRRPDPFDADQASAPLIPADAGGWVTATAANASNDAWAATSSGVWGFLNPEDGLFQTGALAPHLYRWTDGQVPDAPAGNDDESRPSLFTLGPVVYAIGSPTVVVTPVTVTTTSHKAKAKKVKLPAAIYGIHSKLHRGSHASYILSLTFKVRRPVTVGLQALRGTKVVASSGLKHFGGHSGKLSVTLTREHWPTRLRLVTKKSSSGA